MSSQVNFVLVFLFCKLSNYLPWTNAHANTLNYRPGTYANALTVSKSGSNGILRETLLDTVNAVSNLDCACHCSKTSGCEGFRFHDTNGTCEITQTVRGNPSEMKTAYPHFTYYKKIEPRMCGEAPVVQHAQKETEGFFTGALTTYTCDPDFLPCVNRTTSVCQSTGQWENTTGLCGLFRWYNTHLGFNHRLPCGLAESFSVQVLAKPTRKTRFSVNFCKGNDIILHIDFRLKAFKCINLIEINCFIGGTWRNETQKPFNFVRRRELKIVISMKSGQATLQVDESFNATHVCETADPLVDYIRVIGDVFVRKLEIL